MSDQVETQQIEDPTPCNIPAPSQREESLQVQHKRVTQQEVHGSLNNSVFANSQTPVNQSQSDNNQVMTQLIENHPDASKATAAQPQSSQSIQEQSLIMQSVKPALTNKDDFRPSTQANPVNFGNAPPAGSTVDQLISDQKVSSQKRLMTGTNTGFARTTQRTSKNAPSTSHGTSRPKHNQPKFGQTATQFMSRQNPRKQEPVMGIGPGGSDLSQFFTKKGPKPQTAGNVVGSLQMEPNEFGSNQSQSKQVSQFAPNITNIGFQQITKPDFYVNNDMFGSQQQVTTHPGFVGQQIPKPNTSHQSRTGAFTHNLNDRAKSFQRHGGKKTHTNTLDFIGQQRLGSVGAFSSMKPFVQGSSLQKPGQSTRTQTTQANKTHQPATGMSKKTTQGSFTDYNFFSQKLTQNGIPKNQEIKYRKEMQQLKFYQTLNNYPYIMQQQALKQQQQKQLQVQQQISIQQRQQQMQQQQQNQQHINQSQVSSSRQMTTTQNPNNLTTVQSHALAQQANDTMNDHIGQSQSRQQPLISGVGSPGEEQAIRQSIGTDLRERSTKQTVYQMHSSRAELADSKAKNPIGVLQQSHNAKITHNDTLNMLNVGSNEAISEFPNQDHSQAKDEDDSVTKITPAKVNQNNTSKKELLAGGSGVHNVARPSILTHETDLQTSTQNQSQVDNQRLIFDQSPKLKAIAEPIMESDSATKLEKAPSNLLQTEIDQPAIFGTKRVLETNQTPQPMKTKSQQQNMQNEGKRPITSVKPLVNSMTKNTAALPSKDEISRDDVQTRHLGETGSNFGNLDRKKMPVERVEIKQQTASASYLTRVESPQVATETKPGSKIQTMTNSQDALKKQGSGDSRASPLQIKGNQLKRGENDTKNANKEIARVQSQKPIVEPLMNQQEAGKTLYWRLNSNHNNDDGTTVHLEKKQFGSNAGQNATASQNNETSENIKNVLRLQTQTSDIDQLAMQQQQLLQSKQPYQSGQSSINPKNNDTGVFEERVSGVAVGGLFSVWGPSSQQQKFRGVNKGRDNSISNETGGYPYGNITDYGNSFKRSSATANEVKRGKSSIVGFGLEGVEPSNLAHHMQLVNSIINDGSLHNLVFSNGSLNTDYLQQNKGKVAKMIQNSPYKGSIEDDDYENDDLQDDEDDDEHIIVTMLKSMNSKKLETHQLKDMKLEVDIEKIRTEVKLEFFKEIQNKIDIKIESEWQQRMVKFDRLFNKIIAKKLQLDSENALVIKMEEQQKINEERSKNPFYMTLKAQKEERDKFIDFYTSNGNLLGLPTIIEPQSKPDVDESDLDRNDQQEFIDAIQSDHVPSSPKEGLGDLFAHTGVDIEDMPKRQKQTSETDSKIGLSSMRHIDESSIETKSNRDNLFCFYNLQTEIPKTFFSKLGDSKIVTGEAIHHITCFIKSEWPCLSKRRRVTYRVSYDRLNDVFNTVPLGKEAPLSKCCMRNISFVFSRRLQEGGKLVCLDSFCATTEIETFQMTEQLVHSIFNRGLKFAELPTSSDNSVFMNQRRQMQTASAPGKRYQNAVSYELSKRIKAGTYKHQKLEQVIADPKFQNNSGYLTSSRQNVQQQDPTDLMDLIMNVPRTNSKNIHSRHTSQNRNMHPYFDAQGSKSLTNSLVYNENQMLADLIQKQALSKNRHKATLGVTKLMKRLPKPVVPMSQEQYFSLQGKQDIVSSDDGTMSGADNMISQRNNGQYMESMFNQNGPLSGEHSLLRPKLDNILYQDNNASSVRKNNMDIPNIDQEEQEEYVRYDGHLDFQKFEGRALDNSVQLHETDGHEKDGRIDTNGIRSPLIESDMKHLVMRSGKLEREQIRGEASDMHTVGHTMMTAGGLDDAKYSHNKSPMLNALGSVATSNQSKEVSQIPSNLRASH